MNNKIRHRISVGLVFVWTLMASSHAYSWEADTHYGLVKWLAYKAGFSLQDAEIVAAGSVSADESVVLGAVGVMIRTGCRSKEASRHVQQHHFPSGGYVPAQPKDRKVIPGDYSTKNNGNRWARQEIHINGNGIDRRTRLDRFGASLHPLADSWAHQGKPDTIRFCPDDFVWSHPLDRGGFGIQIHDADLTYMHPDDTLKTAESLFEFMGEFLRVNPIYSMLAPKKWLNLKADVKSFAKATNIGEKYTWFNLYPEVWNSFTTYPCFLPKLNLDGRGSETCSPAQPLPAEQTTLGDQPGIESGTPEDLAQMVEKFLTSWIVESEIREAVINFVDVEKVTNRLVEATPVRFAEERNKRLVFAKENAQLWVRTLLAMWLAQDHGLVNARGHGIPEHSDFKFLAERAFDRLKFESLAKAIQVPGAAATYQLQPVEPNGQETQNYLITFKFRHTPRDAMMLLAEKINDNWKISGFFWWII